MIVHDQPIRPEFSGDAERVNLAIDLPSIHDARVAERSPRDGEGHATDSVVGDLMPAQEGELNICASTPSAALPTASSMRSTVGGINVQVRRSR
jgi:hypothetical protein